MSDDVAIGNHPRLGARPRRPSSSTSSTGQAAAGTASPPPARYSAPSSDSAPEDATLAAIVGALLLLGMLVIARPLLFATIDPRVAAAGGLPVATLGTGFLVLVGVDAALTTQIVGALLMLGLIAVPAGAAAPPHRQRLPCTRPLQHVRPSLALARHPARVRAPDASPSSAIIGVGATIYALCFLATSRLGAWTISTRTRLRTATE